MSRIAFNLDVVGLAPVDLSQYANFSGPIPEPPEEPIPNGRDFVVESWTRIAPSLPGVVPESALPPDIPLPGAGTKVPPFERRVNKWVDTEQACNTMVKGEKSERQKK